MSSPVLTDLAMTPMSGASVLHHPFRQDRTAQQTIHYGREKHWLHNQKMSDHPYEGVLSVSDFVRKNLALAAS